MYYNLCCTKIITLSFGTRESIKGITAGLEKPAWQAFFEQHFQT